MPFPWRGSFVIMGSIPGFREGAVIDLERGTIARHMSVEDRWLLMRYRHHLRSLSDVPPRAEEPHSPNPAGPPKLRAVE